MKFEWDEEKRLSNIEKHGFDFVGIEKVFDGETATVFDDRFDYGEKRFVTFGLSEGRVVTAEAYGNRRINSHYQRQKGNKQ